MPPTGISVSVPPHCTPPPVTAVIAGGPTAVTAEDASLNQCPLARAVAVIVSPMVMDGDKFPVVHAPLPLAVAVPI